MHTGLHLGDEVLVEEATGLLVQRAVDGNDVALGEHVLEALDAAAADLLLLLGGQGLVVEVEQLLAVEGLEAAQDTLADAADGDGADDLALEVELVLGRLGHVPVAAGDLLAGGAEVADEREDGHDDVLGDGDDVGAGDLGDGDAAVGLVGDVQVDVVGADAGGDGDLEVLALAQALSGEVTGVEAGVGVSFVCCFVVLFHFVLHLFFFPSWSYSWTSQPLRCHWDFMQRRIDLRSGDDDLGVNHLLLENAVLTLLVGGGDEGVALVLEPFADAELVLCGTEEARLLLGVLLALEESVNGLFEACRSSVEPVSEK